MEFKANYAEMESSAGKIIFAANQYRGEVEALYRDVENLSNVWKGADNLKFVSTVNSYKEDLKALGDIVENYGQFLSKSAQIIKETQNDVTASAGRL